MVVRTWSIVQIILVIVGFIILYSLLQFFISIHPPRYYESKTPQNYDLHYENVSFKTSDQIKIKGWLIPSQTAQGTVIIGHGYPFDKGNILPVAKFLHPDYNLLFYDHRYFGESEGLITTVGVRETKDVEAAVQFVHHKFGNRKPVALYGFSLSASAMLMAQPPVEAIIADSPYANLEKMIAQIYFYFGPLKYPFVKVTSILGEIFFNIKPENVSPMKSVAQSKIPTFVIHGEKDSQISVKNSYLLKESNPKINLWIIEGSDHGMGHALFPDKYERRVKKFLKKQMK
tara:strand:+ start:830 stop:1690 length:861 start_codon:yes stop_codon:yes gene_type:complete